MKKWMIVVLTAALLCAYGAALYHGFSSPVEEPVETTVQTPTTQPQTLPPQTQLPETEPATESPEMEPPETEPTRAPADPDYQLTARHAFVYDMQTGQLRYTLGEMTDQIAPASLTKLFTAYVALQHLQPEEMIVCGEETTWVHPASSMAWVSRGDRLSVSMLIQGMMMQSGNDAAYAVAVAAGRKIAGDPQLYGRNALQVFMNEVNACAAELGLEGTHFVTPDGLDAYGHYTTVEDLLRITLLALENPLIRHYTSLNVAAVTYENGETHTYRNTNYLLDPQSKYYSPDACGMKTGTTGKAGSCLMSLFHNGEGYILIGVLGCPKYEDRFADALQLYALYGAPESS